tara:strand:+ start:1200 stop:1370 length:171 start_codon:yes stop_codon:yes gene_type:complete
MGLEEIVPAIFLLAILFLILPGFLSTNSKINQLLKNLFIWSIIIVSAIIISYLIFK